MYTSSPLVESLTLQCFSNSPIPLETEESGQHTICNLWIHHPFTELCNSICYFFIFLWRHFVISCLPYKALYNIYTELVLMILRIFEAQP